LIARTKDSEVDRGRTFNRVWPFFLVVMVTMHRAFCPGLFVLGFLSWAKNLGAKRTGSPPKGVKENANRTAAY